MICDRCNAELFECSISSGLRCFCTTGAMTHQHFTPAGERIVVAERAPRQIELGAGWCEACEASYQSREHRQHVAQGRIEKMRELGQVGG